MINEWLGIKRAETIGAVLARHRGVGPGFDLMRIALALYIFYGHTLWVAGGATSVAGVAAIDGAIEHARTAAILTPAGGGFTGWTRPFHIATVPVFFALSGFLVTGSALRLRATSTFLAFRALRIFPALVVETILCAVVLGAVLTTEPLGAYFSDTVFFRYLGNMLGIVTFHLPGLFERNPVAGIVNANLWTLPSEFECYLVMGVLMATRIVYHRLAYTIVYAVVAVAFAVASLTTGYAITPGILAPVAITFYFFTGVLLYHWQGALPAHWALFLGAAMASYVLLLFPASAFIAPLIVSYCTIFFGLIAIPKLPLIGTGDYSYGIYLYGFPIAQALVAAFPDTFIGERWLLLGVAGVLTCAFSAFSWHFIEKHALGLKRHLPRRWFPTPSKAVRQTPAGRAGEASDIAA